MIKRCFMPGAAMVLLSACNGLMGGLYDEAAEESSTDSAFTAPCTPTTPGTIRIDATDYAVWTYIDLTNRTVEPLPVDAPEPEHWDFAIHRYDAKTNGGEVAATDSRVLCAGLSPASAYVPDQWTTETIITDVSGMMDGVLLYAESFYNHVLSSWLDVDKSSMPPVYTPSGLVYLLRMPDGSCAALRLADFMDSAGVKGHMTIEYIYPYI